MYVWYAIILLCVYLKLRKTLGLKHFSGIWNHTKLCIKGLYSCYFMYFVHFLGYTKWEYWSLTVVTKGDEVDIWYFDHLCFSVSWKAFPCLVPDFNPYSFLRYLKAQNCAKRLFVLVILCVFWDTRSEKTGLWQLPNLSSVFNLLTIFVTVSSKAFPCLVPDSHD